MREVQTNHVNSTIYELIVGKTINEEKIQGVNIDELMVLNYLLALWNLGTLSDAML